MPTIATPVVAEKIEREVQHTLAGLASFEMPKRIGLLEQEFSVERGELTPKMSVRRRVIAASPLHGQVAAVSVGIVGGTSVVDLDYAEDSQAETDMNIVMNEAGRFIEVQGTAEGHAFSDDEFNAMLALARSGIAEIIVAQNEAIAAAL